MTCLKALYATGKLEMHVSGYNSIEWWPFFVVRLKKEGKLKLRTVQMPTDGMSSFLITKEINNYHGIVLEISSSTSVQHPDLAQIACPPISAHPYSTNKNKYLITSLLVPIIHFVPPFLLFFWTNNLRTRSLRILCWNLPQSRRSRAGIIIDDLQQAVHRLFSLYLPTKACWR